MSVHVAVDLGAESGRGVLVRLSGGLASMEEIHRWPNRPVRLGRTLHWDFPFLYAEVTEAIARCAVAGITPAGISVDTWGVDFGLLDGSGGLLGNPVHYRDARTNDIPDIVFAAVSSDEIFQETGIQFMQLNTLFQLFSMRHGQDPQLDAADTLLMMPDLFHYWLRC